MPSSYNPTAGALRRIHRLGLAGALVLGALLPGVVDTAWAEDVLLYRCTSADGSLTVQNAPCPAGTTQRIQRFAAPPASLPAAAPLPAAPPADGTAVLQHTPLPVLQHGGVQTTVAVDAGGDDILDSDVLRRQAQQQAAAEATAKPALPEIYQCQREDGSRYLHEREPAPPHCELMTVTGMGGVTPVNAAGCEVIRDQCDAIAEPQRCSSWQQRFRDARGSERFAAPQNLPAAVAERERLQALLTDSDCPVP